jgi:hypothetical protein
MVDRSLKQPKTTVDYLNKIQTLQSGGKLQRYLKPSATVVSIFVPQFQVFEGVQTFGNGVIYGGGEGLHTQ